MRIYKHRRLLDMDGSFDEIEVVALADHAAEVERLREALRQEVANVTMLTSQGYKQEREVERLRAGLDRAIARGCCCPDEYEHRGDCYMVEAAECRHAMEQYKADADAATKRVAEWETRYAALYDYAFDFGMGTLGQFEQWRREFRAKER
jgi:hypothetical protein